MDFKIRLSKYLSVPAVCVALLSAGCDSDKSGYELSLQDEGRNGQSLVFVQIPELREGSAKQLEVRDAMTPVVQLISGSDDQNFQPIPIDFVQNAQTGDFSGVSPALVEPGSYMLEVDWQVQDSSIDNNMVSIATVKYALDYDETGFSVPMSESESTDSDITDESTDESQDNPVSCPPSNPCQIAHETDDPNQPVFADSDGDNFTNLQELNIGTSWIGEGAIDDPRTGGTTPSTASVENLVLVSQLAEDNAFQTDWGTQGQLVIRRENPTELLATWSAHYNAELEVFIQLVSPDPEVPVKGRLIVGDPTNLASQGELNAEGNLEIFFSAESLAPEGFPVEVIVQNDTDQEIGRGSYIMMLRPVSDAMEPSVESPNQPELSLMPNEPIINECTAGFKISATTLLELGQTLEGEWSVNPSFVFGSQNDVIESGTLISTINFTVPINDTEANETYTFTYAVSDPAADVPGATISSESVELIVANRDDLNDETTCSGS